MTTTAATKPANYEQSSRSVSKNAGDFGRSSLDAAVSEKSQPPPTPPSTGSRRRRSSGAPGSAGTAPRSPSPSSSSSPARLLVKLNGRVYRPPSPDDLRTKREQEADLWLQEPTETVADLEQGRRERKRKLLEDEMRRERLNASVERARTRRKTGAHEEEASGLETTPKATGRLLRFDSDDDLDVTGSPGQNGSAAQSPLSMASPSRRRAVTPPRRPLGAANGGKQAVSPALGLPFAFQTQPPPATALPPHLASLLSLHAAVERTIILHLSTAGSTIASTVSDTTVDPEDGSSTTTVRMTNLIDASTLGRMLESTGKRFTETELRRLVWVWQGAGVLPASASASSRDQDVSASPFRRKSSSGNATESIVLGRDSEDEVGGMGFLVTRARTASSSPGHSSGGGGASNGSSSLLNASGARVSHCYGVGIAVAVRSNPQLPKLELVSPGRKQAQAGPPPSPSSIGKGRDGMSIVALWAQGKEQRQKEVERRLRAWAERQLKTEPDAEPDVFGSSPAVPMVPLAALPLLSPAVPAIPSTSTPSPRKATTSTGSTLPNSTARPEGLPVVSPQKFVDTLLTGKPLRSKAGKAADRERALRERIQAKQQAQQKSAYHASLSALSSGEPSPTKRSLKRHAGGAGEDATAAPFGPGAEGEAPVSLHEIRKRNAMLSRLGSVADVVAMRCQGRPILWEEVCTVIANSPLVSIGYDEADSALTFLAEHFPNFCYVKLVGSEPWLSLRGVQKAVEVKELVRQQLARAAEALDAAR